MAAAIFRRACRRQRGGGNTNGGRRGRGRRGGHLLLHPHRPCQCDLRFAGALLRLAGAALVGGNARLVRSAVAGGQHARRRGGGRRGLVLFLVDALLEAEQAGEEFPDALAGIVGGHFDRALGALKLGQRFLITRQRLAVAGDVDGLLVREDAHELVVGHARPVPDAAGVEMHEVAAGIEADAAALHAQAHHADGGQVGARNVEVHGLAAHVLALLGHALGAGAQHGIRRGRAIAAQHRDALLAAHVPVDLPNEVEQLGVHLGGLGMAPVAQEPVKLLQRLRVIATLALEGEGPAFLGVVVVEGEGARVAIGHRVLERGRADEDDRQRGDHGLRPAAAGQTGDRGADSTGYSRKKGQCREPEAQVYLSRALIRRAARSSTESCRVRLRAC